MSKKECRENREAKSNLLPLYLKDHHVGRVHSTFLSGLNLEFDENLIYIGSSNSSLSAFGVRINEEKLREILCSVTIDNIVINKKNRLIFYTIDGIIDLSCNTIEEMDLRLPQIKCSSTKILDSKLYNYLKSLEFEKLIGIELDEKNSNYLELLTKSDKQDVGMNTKLIEFFTGRGKGLTPSGDDILIGCTLALILFGSFPSWRRILTAYLTSQRTTMISVAYLNALLQGYASECFIKLVRLLDQEELEEIKSTIQAVQSFGHTSGNDTLFGFFLGLTCLTNQLEG